MRNPGGLRGAAVLAIVVLVSALLGWGSVRHVAVLRMIEQWTGDLRLATPPPEPQHPEIIVVAINEETLEQFPYRAPIDRQFLSDLLLTLENKGARALLLDILLDQPTEPEKDAALRSTLQRLRIPTVVSYVHGKNYLTPKQADFQNQFVPAKQRGLANLVKDPFDNTVRLIFPGEKVAGQGFMPGIAGLLASRLGVEPPTGWITMVWKGRPDVDTEPFAVIPAHLVPILPPAWFAGKIALIGADLSLTDRHRTPFSTISHLARGLNHFGTAGVVIHAHALAQIMGGHPAPNPGSTSQAALHLGAAGSGLLLAASPLGFATRLLLALAATLLYWLGSFYLFHFGGPLIPLLAPTLAFIVSLLASDLHLGRGEREQRKFIRNAFSRYLAPAVVEQLLNNRDALRLGGERREMTFLFTDVADFTTLSEEMDATELTHLLNRYLNGLCQVILRHEGTVINFIGDAVFALFGAPARQEDHPCRAMACALELDAFAEAFQRQWNQQGIPFGSTRVGVHTGYAAIGNMGSEERFQYTSLGDAVNTAARLEGFNKFIGSRVCVSEETVKRCPHLHARPVAAVVLKGKSRPITVYEPLTPEQHHSLRMQSYRTAYALLEADRPETAVPLFQQLAQTHPPDPCALFHWRRIQNGARNSAIHMDSK
ncbi:MAG: adenylate/guanylate cyclase domain-containing protein [Magnetococcales bacterium]|nr:adenylate/guanylate cyclase domain-containing protein [Magnetococcales bacterium]